MRISVCRTGEQWSCFWSPSVEKLQHRPLSGCGGSNCLLCRGIYEVEGLSSSLILRSYFLSSVFTVSVLCSRCHAAQALWCERVWLSDSTSHHTLLLSLSQPRCPSGQLGFYFHVIDTCMILCIYIKSRNGK